MRRALLYIIVSAASFLLTSCPDPACLNPNPSYTFEVTAHFTPEKDSIRIGDTLYLVSEFPSTLMPAGRGGLDSVNYRGSTGIGNAIGILELIDKSNTLQGAVLYFDYISLIGKIYNSTDIPSPEKFQQLQYDETYGHYLLKVGFIPKKKGIYLLGINNGLSNGRKENNCEKAIFQTRLTNSKLNHYYYENWLDMPVDQKATDISYLIKVY